MTLGDLTEVSGSSTVTLVGTPSSYSANGNWLATCPVHSSQLLPGRRVPCCRPRQMSTCDVYAYRQRNSERGYQGNEKNFQHWIFPHWLGTHESENLATSTML